MTKTQGIPKDLKLLEKQLPIEQPIFKTNEHTIKYTWIGHSTAVINIQNKVNIIIDPVFLQRVAPTQYVGPKRFRRAACTIQQLPQIDLVLVSHDHYDHMEYSTLQKLYQKNKNTKFISGLGSKDIFNKQCHHIQMDWTQSYNMSIKDVQFKITFVPVCHWGRRGLMDQNTRLWGGFVVEINNNKKIFYSGDTGSCPIFQQLGKIFKKFDLSILPIGAYQPRPFLQPQHINPQQAVIIHKQLNSKKSVGVHWGTFPLGCQHYTAARSDLKNAKKKHKLKQEQFVTVNHGGSFEIDL